MIREIIVRGVAALYQTIKHKNSLHILQAVSFKTAFVLQ
nr:MAG TPA: hypothetical protein [Bacteriophage sp.]